jgi:peptidoglycan/LPS O-acetylase OafA/YrhL
VGGVTTGLPYDGSINGALWSLFPECLCYLLVLILGVLGLLQGKRTSLFLFTALLAGMHFGLTLAPAQGENLAPTLLRLTHWSPYFLAFFVGACAFAAREQIEPNWKAAVFWGLVTLTLLRFGGWALAGPVVLPLAIIHLAYSGRVHLPGDISYGIYVLHFPVLQWLAGTSLRSHGWGWFLAAGLGLTGLLATASWLAVERPCLRLKTRAVSAG